MKTLALLFLLFLPFHMNGQPPNIILIVSDDQGYYDLGCYGNQEIMTPNLDELASAGMRFTNFYVTCSACTPSRGSLLTGRYPQRNGTYELFRNDRVNDGYQYPENEYNTSPERILGMDLREILLSDLLKSAGYTNGIFGKWDLGQLKRYLPLQRGFDDFYGFANTGIDYFTHERYGVPSMFDGNQPTTKDKGTYSSDLFRREALHFIDKNKERPFFLYLPFNAPHSASNLEPSIRGSVQAPEDYLKQYPAGTTKEERREQGYRAAITHMDQCIGEILNRVKDYSLEDNTFVIFLSDNGGGIGSRNTPLRGKKAQFFDGGIRVPCILKYPNKIEAGVVNDEFISSLEIFPTILEAANVEIPDDIVLDGSNMMPMLLGNTASAPTRDIMFWEFRGDFAARMGKWKWVSSKSGNGLFDLENDIGEARDLSVDRADILQIIEQRFYDWQAEMEAAEPRGPFRNY